MASTITSAVMIPRFTAIVGAGPYYTLPVDVSAFSKAYLTAWRGAFIGSGAGVTFAFKESTDRNFWDDCPGTSPDDPGLQTEVQYVFDLTKRWFRVEIDLTGTNPGMTAWIQGHFEDRELD